MPLSLRTQVPVPGILQPASTRDASSRLLPIAAAMAAAVAAWLSQGTLAFTGSGSGRIALLPLSITAVALVLGAALLAARLARRSWVPFVLLGLLALPWLPGTLPPAFHLWSGALGLLVWTAVLLASVAPRRLPPLTARAPLAAGVLAACVFAVAAWQVSPSVPGGDEPHYLVITQSLLNDGDLKIENNHVRGDYRAYFAGQLPPDFRVRGRDGEIYSIHAPGVSVLVAPAFAIAGYPGVVVFLVLLAAAGSALAWHLAWLVTGRADAAWFGWAAVTLSTTYVFHSFTVYPDGPGAVIALTGAWALLRARDEAATGAASARPWLLHGLALALLPWLHTRFSLIAGGLGAMILWRLAPTTNAAGKAVAFLAVPAVSALGWVAYFVAIYGRPDPSAPYGGESGSFMNIPGGFVGLMFDQRFGLLAYAPVLLFGLTGLGVMAMRREHRRLAFELLFVLVPYLLVVTHFDMWWGGHSAPARFAVPIVLMLAAPAAVAWTRIEARATRATAWAALVFTIFASTVLIAVDGGRLAYNTREGYAAWLAWINPAADLGRALPAFWRGREGEMYRDAALWIAALAAAWGLLRMLERAAWARQRAAFATATAGVFALAAMAAVTTVWAVTGVEGLTATPAQLELLRRIGDDERLFAVEPGTYRRVPAAAVPAMIRIEPEPNTAPGGAGRNDRPLFMLPTIPAGQYRLRFEGAGQDAWIAIGIGRDQFALRTLQLGTPPEPLVMDFPVAVRALVVRGDEALRRSLRGLTIEPLSLVAPASRLSAEFARRGVRYGALAAYFLDEHSFPEPEAFWVGGGREAAVVLQPDSAAAVATLVVRNAPVENRVRIQAGRWREELRLAPGEERRVDVPLDMARGATLVEFSSSGGFRPSESDPKSRDGRFLGVWVKVLEP